MAIVWYVAHRINSHRVLVQIGVCIKEFLCYTEIEKKGKKEPKSPEGVPPQAIRDRAQERVLIPLWMQMPMLSDLYDLWLYSNLKLIKIGDVEKRMFYQYQSFRQKMQ